MSRDCCTITTDGAVGGITGGLSTSFWFWALSLGTGGTGFVAGAIVYGALGATGVWSFSQAGKAHQNLPLQNEDLPDQDQFLENNVPVDEKQNKVETASAEELSDSNHSIELNSQQVSQTNLPPQTETFASQTQLIENKNPTSSIPRIADERNLEFLQLTIIDKNIISSNIISSNLSNINEESGRTSSNSENSSYEHKNERKEPKSQTLLENEKLDERKQSKAATPVTDESRKTVFNSFAELKPFPESITEQKSYSSEKVINEELNSNNDNKSDISDDSDIINRVNNEVGCSDSDCKENEETQNRSAISSADGSPKLADPSSFAESKIFSELPTAQVLLPAMGAADGKIENNKYSESFAREIDTSEVDINRVRNEEGFGPDFSEDEETQSEYETKDMGMGNVLIQNSFFSNSNSGNSNIIQDSNFELTY